MVVYVTESGSDHTELAEVLVAEGVTFQECPAKTSREMGFSSVRIIEVQANLPEVRMPGVTDERYWRLPSGRMIITDLEGNLDRIAIPPPTK